MVPLPKVICWYDGRQRLDEALLQKHAGAERGQDRDARGAAAAASERLGAATAFRAPDTSPDTDAEASDRCSRIPRTSRARSRVEA